MADLVDTPDDDARADECESESEGEEDDDFYWDDHAKARAQMRRLIYKLMHVMPNSC